MVDIRLRDLRSLGTPCAIDGRVSPSLCRSSSQASPSTSLARHKCEGGKKVVPPRAVIIWAFARIYALCILLGIFKVAHSSADKLDTLRESGSFASFPDVV